MRTDEDGMPWRLHVGAQQVEQLSSRDDVQPRCGMHLDFINYDAVESFKDFGGIRLEDDILITPDGSRFLGEKRIPITIEEVEDIMNE